MFAETLADARAGGASAAQLEILEQAQQSGEVTLEQERQAIASVVDCFTDAGLVVTTNEETGADGITIPGYTVGTRGDLDAVTPIIDACETAEVAWVHMLYQLQPVNRERREAFIESVAPALRACLEEAGQSPAADATPQELVALANELIASDSAAIDCLDEVGAY